MWVLLKKRKIFDGKKDMIRTLDLKTRTGTLDHPRVETYAALRQQPIRTAELLQQARTQLRLGSLRQQGSQQQRIGDHLNGVDQADAIWVQVGRLGGLAHEAAQGIMGQQERIALLKNTQRA